MTRSGSEHLKNPLFDSLEKQEVLLFPKTSTTVPRPHTSSYQIITRFPFPGVRLPKREAEHPLPYSVEVKNKWRLTSISHITSNHGTTSHQIWPRHSTSRCECFPASSLSPSSYSVFFLFSVSFLFPTQLSGTTRGDKSRRTSINTTLAFHSWSLSVQTDIRYTTRPFREIAP